MIAQFKNLVELKIVPFFQKVSLGVALTIAILGCWTVSPFSLFAQTERAEIVETRPDESNPFYEIVKTKEGHIFRIPKGLPIEKRDGMIIPMSTDEYFINHLEALKEQVQALTQRVAAIEKNMNTTTERREVPEGSIKTR